MLESIPLHRGADPKEVAKVVLFLALDDALYVTGGRWLDCVDWIAEFSKADQERGSAWSSHRQIDGRSASP